MDQISQRPKPRVFRSNQTVVQRAAPPAEIDLDPTIEPEADQISKPRKRGILGRIVGIALGSLIALLIAAYVFSAIKTLFAAHPWLGWVGLALGAVLLGALLLVVFRELATVARMTKVDGLRERAEAAWISGARNESEMVLHGLDGLYRRRAEYKGPRLSIKERLGDAPDGETLLTLIETESMRELDERASDAARRASGRVAAATALLPSGLLDAMVVLYLNVRMLREIAEVYGGRSGWIGSWRLLKNVAVR